MATKEKKVDSRIIRSKRDLANSLEELLQEKNLDDISITEITERALVSKNTFYNNFTDKNGLLNFLFNRYEQCLEEEIDNIIKETGDDVNKALYKSVKAIVHFFYNSKISFERIVKNDASKTLFWAMNDFIQSLVKKLFKKYNFYAESKIPANLLGYIYSGAISNMIYYMYSIDSKITEEDCTNYVYDILNKQLLN